MISITETPVEPVAVTRCILHSGHHAPHHPSPHRVPHVVIVDDDPVTVAILQDIIEAMELCEVFAFTSSAKALDWCRQKSLSSCAHQLAGEVRRATAGLMKQEQETIFLLCRAAELRDPDTGAHLQRMSSYSRIIAANLGMSEQEQELVYMASPLHDIGKVAVSDDILQKSGKLDAGEFAMITRHTLLGHEILRESSSPILQCGAQIALSHHEKFDGSGYPQGLAGVEIPLCGRIAAVADVFDALTSERPYKHGWEAGSAAEEIISLSGVHFDPQCVTAFLGGWDEILAIHEEYRGGSVQRPPGQLSL